MKEFELKPIPKASYEHRKWYVVRMNKNGESKKRANLKWRAVQKEKRLQEKIARRMKVWREVFGDDE